MQYFIIWLQYYARSNWLFSCNDRTLLVGAQGIYNLC